MRPRFEPNRKEGIQWRGGGTGKGRKYGGEGKKGGEGENLSCRKHFPRLFHPGILLFSPFHPFSLTYETKHGRKRDALPLLVLHVYTLSKVKKAPLLKMPFLNPRYVLRGNSRHARFADGWSLEPTDHHNNTNKTVCGKEGEGERGHSTDTSQSHH